MSGGEWREEEEELALTVVVVVVCVGDKKSNPRCFVRTFSEAVWGPSSQPRVPGKADWQWNCSCYNGIGPFSIVHECFGGHRNCAFFCKQRRQLERPRSGTEYGLQASRGSYWEHSDLGCHI